MRCRKVSANLTRYSAGALSQRETADIERHLLECSACAKQMESLNAVMRMVEAVEPLSPPPGMWDGVRARLEAQATLEAQSPSPIGCEQVVASLGSYSADALREREMQDVECHLRTCDDCAREWSSFRLTLDAVESLEAKSPPPFLWEKVRDALDTRQTRSTWWRQPKVVPAFAGGLALAAMLAFAVVKAGHERRAPLDLMQPAQVASNLDFVQQHAAMAQNELFADRAALGTLVNYVPANYRR